MKTFLEYLASLPACPRIGEQWFVDVETRYTSETGHSRYMLPATQVDNLNKGSYRGCVLLPDGLALIMPRNKVSEGTTNKFQLFDYKTDTFTELDYGATGNYRGGVLLPGGEDVLCIPKGNTNAAVYHHPTREFTRLTDFIGTFIGGFTLPDGTVFCVPYSASEACLYHPDTRKLEYLGYKGTHYGSIPNNDCTKLLIPPFKPESNFVVYEYKTKKFTDLGITGKWCSGVLLPSGEALIVSGGDNPSLLFNFETMTFKDANIPKSVFRSAKLLPTGEVFCFAKSGSWPGVYNWKTDTFEAYPAPADFINGQLLPDGRVLALPKETPEEKATIFGAPFWGKDNPTPPEVMEFITSPFFNKY